MTGWDFAWRILHSWPVAIVVTGGLAMAILFSLLWLWGRWLDYKARAANPEVALREDMQRLLQTEIDQVLKYRAEVGRLERRTGRLLILVRALENAMDECGRRCPECRNCLDRALEHARAEAVHAGLMREEDTITGLHSMAGGDGLE